MESADMEHSPTAIDVAAGRFTFTEPACAIDAKLTLEGLATSPLQAHCEVVTQNPPWKLLGYRSAVIGAETFVGHICFRDSALQHFTLIAPRPEFGTSWADFSMAKEHARQKFHNDWLARQLGGAVPTVKELAPYRIWE
jgi:hypothetical protein